MSPKLKTNLKYASLIFICYVVFLIATLPASVAYSIWTHLNAKSRTPVQLYDIDGTVWSGQIGKATINGQNINTIRWNVNLSTLFLGIMEADFDLAVPDGFAKGTAGYSLLGSLYFNNVEAWLPLPHIDNLINLAALKPGGAVDIKLANVKISSDKAIVSARGDIAWHSAEMTMFKKLSLGDLQITFEPNDDGTKGVISDQGGPLTAQGILQLNADKSYTFNGAFGLRGEQPDLQAALTTMGRFDRDGKVKVSLKGNLAQFGF